MPTRLGLVVREARESKKLSVAEVSARSGVSRAMIAEVESGKNVSVDTLEKLALALGLVRLPLSNGLELEMSGAPNLSYIRSLAQRIEREASEITDALVVPQRSATTPQGARVLPFPAPSRPRITLAEEVEQIDELRAALAGQPTADAEWRKGFRGRKKYVVARAGDAAAGAGAEAEALPLDEEETRLREIPEHYWEERGARHVLRLRGNSLSGLGYVDRDLIFIRPARTATNNDVVVCTLDGLVYVKVFRRLRGKAWLLSANPDFKPIPIGANEAFHVRGVVVGRSGYALPGENVADPGEGKGANHR